MKAKTTDQKIRLSVDVFEKLKEFAIQVSVHRKKQTTWTDLLRYAAQSMGKAGSAERMAKNMDAVVAPTQAEQPTSDASPTHDKPKKYSVVVSEDTFNRLAKLAQEVSALRDKQLNWGDIGRFAIYLLFRHLDANDIVEKLGEYPKFEAHMSPTQATDASEEKK